MAHLNLQLSYPRLAVLVLSGFLLGMLALDLRFDTWYLASFTSDEALMRSRGGWGQTQQAQYVQTAARYYHHVDREGSFIPRLIDVTIAVVGACGVSLVLSHRSTEAGSTSCASDFFNLLLFAMGAPYFALVVQPALARITKGVEAHWQHENTMGSNSPIKVMESDFDLSHAKPHHVSRSDLVTVAQGHLVLVGIVSAV